MSQGVSPQRADSVLNLPVISASLDPTSKSRKLAQRAVSTLREAGHDVEFIDLVDIELPRFDNSAVFNSAQFQFVHDVISGADAIVLAMPIYNWAPPAQLKSLIESTGATGDGVNTAAWFDKPVTFLCSAGLAHSYMATGALAQSLMLDFKCVINPYVGYFSSEDWLDETAGVLNPEREERFAKTLTVHQELAALLRQRGYRSGWEV